MAAAASAGSPSDFTQSGSPRRSGSSATSAVAPLDVAHRVLDARVVLEPVHRQVLAVARLLVATVRHLGDERDVAVDPDAAEVEPPRHPHRAPVVLGPDARGEPVRHAVRPLDRLVLVVEALHGDDGAEDLVLDHLVVLAQAVDDGRLVEEAALALAVATGDDLR